MGLAKLASAYSTLAARGAAGRTAHHLRSLLTSAPSLKCRSTARRSPPSVFLAQNPSTTKPAKKAQNARSAKRPRPPRRRLGPARPQHLLRGGTERRAGARLALGACVLPSWLRRPRLRPNRAAPADDGARGPRVRPRHLWLVLRPDLAAAAHDGALFKQLWPRRVRPGLHATATLLLPPEEGRARHVNCRKRHVLEGDLRPHVPGPVPDGHLARDLVDW